MSKTVKYWTTGTRQPNFTAEGTPRELLKWLAYFPPGKDVPPLAVMNDVFRKGFRDGGFNGDTHWEPFELNATEYDECVRELLADADAGYRTLPSPAWVATELDWLAYVSSINQGVPVEPYRTLLYRYHAAVDELHAARASGRRVPYLLKTLRMYGLAREMQRFLAKYADPQA